MLRPFLLLYSLLYALLTPVYALGAALGLVRRGRRLVLLPRLGLARRLAEIPVPREGFTVWIHAVSVGEVNAVKPLLEALAARPGISIYLSTTTSTGQVVARGRFGDLAQVGYFPLDLRWSCRRFLRHLKPRLVLLVETELWPNFLVAAQAENCPVILVNGRISERSHRRYRRHSTLFSPLIRCLAHACMQSRQDKERMLELGMPEERVNWVGNLKFECRLQPDPGFAALREAIRARLKPDPQDLLWLCGSTKPGEEELLLPVLAGLRRRFPGLRLLLAPRHPHRAEEVASLAVRNGLTCELRSRLPDRTSTPLPDLLILDTVGELSQLYELADLVFMGGSLVPTGGQNLIEPAFFGKPILVGPHMDNFLEVTREFREAYAVLQVQNARELEDRLGDLLQDHHAREWLGRNARKVIRNNQGALDRTMEIISGYLGGTK